MAACQTTARGGHLDAREPESRYYRYSVRCDRAFSQAVEKAAAKAGMSVTAFVQAHFDRICDARPPAPAPAFGAATFDPAGFGRKHGLWLDSARAYGLLAGRADAAGKVTVSATQLRNALCLEGDRARKCLGQLVEAGLIIRLQIGRKGTLYQMVRP